MEVYLNNLPGKILHVILDYYSPVNEKVFPEKATRTYSENKISDLSQ